MILLTQVQMQLLAQYRLIACDGSLSSLVSSQMRLLRPAGHAVVTPRGMWRRWLSPCPPVRGAAGGGSSGEAPATLPLLPATSGAPAIEAPSQVKPVAADVAPTASHTASPGLHSAVAAAPTSFSSSDWIALAGAAAAILSGVVLSRMTFSEDARLAAVAADFEARQLTTIKARIVQHDPPPLGMLSSDHLVVPLVNRPAVTAMLSHRSTKPTVLIAPKVRDCVAPHAASLIAPRIALLLML